MFNNQGNSKPEASQKENGDMAWAGCEELVELDDVQLATVVGGASDPALSLSLSPSEYGEGSSPDEFLYFDYKLGIIKLKCPAGTFFNLARISCEYEI